MRYLRVFALIAALLLAACRAEEAPSANEVNLNINLEIEPTDYAVGDAEVYVTLTDGNDAPVDGATVAVRGDMNHAGMVPVLAETTESTDGVYTLPFEWTMGGDWIVEITVTLADGTTAAETFNYSVAGAGTMEDMAEHNTHDAEATEEHDTPSDDAEATAEADS